MILNFATRMRTRTTEKKTNKNDLNEAREKKTQEKKNKETRRKNIDEEREEES